MAIIVYENKTFSLQTKDTSYVFGVDEQGFLRHFYWGAKIEEVSDFEATQKEDNGYHPYQDRILEEFSSFGAKHFKETAVKIEYADGTKDFRYQVKKSTVKDGVLEIELRDIHYPFSVFLYYQVMEEENMIKKWVRAVNHGSEEIVVERLYSAQFGMEETGFSCIQYNGTWAKEFKMETEVLHAGKKVYESLRGSTAHMVNPSFILHKNASEECGDVYFGLLEYSGNFKLSVEVTPYETTNVLLGISDTDFAWVLKGGESLEMPAVYAGYTNKGLTEMSHMSHQMCHKYLMPEQFAKTPLKVLYNSWYATIFDVQCEEQKKLAEKAAAIGTELFVVDDGWFGTRDDDHQSLGDWYVDNRKFPNGLDELISHVKQLGMSFGIWVEPEMVNEKSSLFQKHPDWVYQYPNREILKGRNQYALDLTNDEVVRFMIQFMDELLSNYEITYIKWDMNRPIYESGASGLGKQEQKAVWLTHTRNLYHVLEVIREKHPQVEIEACASGGGRVDLGAMRYFDEYWPSDNTDPLDRLDIQRGYSLLYPIKYMRAWTTDSPDGWTGRSVPLSFAADCAMCGSLGIGNNLNEISTEELEILTVKIALYKEIRNVVQFGDLYRLQYFGEQDFHAVEYLLDDKGVVFTFLPQCRYGKKQYRVKLRGLETSAIYQVKNAGEIIEKTGAYLMHHGLDVVMKGDYDSKVIRFSKINKNTNKM